MRKIVLLLLTLPLLVFVGYQVHPLVFPKSSEPVLSTQTVTVEPEPLTPQKLLEYTNAERVKAGVKPVAIDERLNQSAQKKANELISEGWDDTPHVNNDGRNTANYILDVMPACYVASENLARNYTKNPIQGFQTSKPHWDAILDTRFEYIGFGTTDNYVVVHFCSID